MQPVFQSTFLQALGFAIANSLWQTALVWLVYISVNSLVSFSAATKYRLAVAAQFMGFVWFMITLQFYYSQYTDALQHSTAVVSGVQNILSANTDFSSRLIHIMLKAEEFLPYVSMAYLLLMVFLSIRWFLGYQQTQMIRKSGLQKISADWRLFVKRIAGQLGIKKNIRLFLSDTISTPLTIGFFKPIILIPVASINHLTTDQLEAVLLHELAHIKRYDYLLNIILSVVELTLFFNPFTQLLSKSIRKERENSCDDWVLQFKYNATAYAEALLRIACLQSAPAFAMAAGGHENELLVRVKRMIHQKENRFSYRKQLLAFFIVTGMLSSIAWLNPITSPHQQVIVADTQKNPVKKVQTYAVEPMAVSVDNPLFNPMFFLSKPLKAEMKKNMVSAQKEIALAQKETRETAGNLIESIPPIVANALEQAAVAFTDKTQAEWEKGISSLEIAKTSLEKAFHNDSAFAAPPKKMRVPFAKDMALSIKEMNDEIKKARGEMETQLKEKKAAFFDEEKLETEIKKALEQVNRIDIGKLMAKAFNMPDMLLTEESSHLQKIRMLTHTFPRVPDNMRKIKGNRSAETEIPCPDPQQMEAGIYPDAASTPAPPMINQDREKNRLDAAKLILLKQWLLKETARKQVKLVPVSYLVDGEKETQLVIVLQ